jgi:hypothetical protein
MRKRCRTVAVWNERRRRVKTPVTWGVNDPPTTVDRVGRLLTEDELVDEALEESFPASDPPFWTLGWERPVTHPLPDAVAAATQFDAEEPEPRKH